MNNEPVAWMDYLEHSDVYDLNVSGRGIPLYTHPVKEVIFLTKAELESGLTRVQWAEALIKQLPEEHEGRNSWLLNYGKAQEKRTQMN